MVGRLDFKVEAGGNEDFERGVPTGWLLAGDVDGVGFV